MYLLEELLSPLITPCVLTFSLRHKALDIVDFYRNFTVEVTGVGDVCSFAQMDVRKHGNPQVRASAAAIHADAIRKFIYIAGLLGIKSFRNKHSSMRAIVASGGR